MNNHDTESKDSLEQEPYVGMPITSMNAKFDNNHEDCRYCQSVDQCRLAMAYVPWQRWCETYDPNVGFHRGTIFPELDMPFLGGGGC